MVWCVDSPALTSARTQANQKERSTGDSIRDNSSTTKIHLIIIETAPLISRTDFALFASWLTYQGRKAVVNICQWSPM
jgi:septal ring-binding cell division protein DamX